MTIRRENNQYTNGTTYIKTSSIVNVLKSNNVKIQAIDRDYGNADITLDSALKVDQTTTGRNTLTLESQGDVNINADINATSPLNVVLNADSDSNDKGGVNINADIRTGGGSLTTGANGATFFGGTNSGENNRVIETSGGNVKIQNEARLQLNGGTLSVNTAGGSVTFARNVASMNKYEAFMDHDFVNGLETPEAAAWENMIKLVYGQSYTNSNDQSVQFIVDGKSKYESLDRSQKIKASNMLAQTWELANLAATQGNRSDPDGKQLNGMHLVTITDKYENSAAMANAVKKNGAVLEYFTGGKETTNMSASRTSGRQFAWATGPEKGTTFYISSGIGQGSDQNGMYTNWVQGGNGYSEPNNNNGLTKQPYVAIGWTDENGWDDVHNGASTIHGFIRETELPNSALSINSGAGDVTVGTKGTANTGKLGSGVGTGLRNVSIETTTGDVKVLDSIYVHDNNTNAASDLANGNVKITTQGNVDVGKITADKKVEISSTGAEKHVNVNGKITTDGLVSIESADDITVHGIQNAYKIRLVSTDANSNGAITLANNPDGNGALVTFSTANDAVIIDARGTNGSFHNNTTAAKAITTGTNGNWKVYSASPDRDTFGTNLNSGTNAQWHANSNGANGLDKYAAMNDGNKYIFQVQPNLTVTAEDKEKTYGVELSDSDLTVTKTAKFKGQDGTDIDVHNYEAAFQEGDVMNHYTGTINVESAGAAAAATRTGGARDAEDGNKAIYDIAVSGNLTSKDGYGAAKYVNGNLEINRRAVNLNGSATQTYGNATLNNKTVYAETGSGDTGLYGNDKLDAGSVEYAISTDGKYAASKGDRTTADAGTYADELEFSDVHVVNGTTNMDANYTFTGNGDITVDKHTITRNELGLEGSPLFTTVYGTTTTPVEVAIKGVNGDATVENTATTSAYEYNADGTPVKTKDVGDKTYDITSVLTNKNYRFEDGSDTKLFANTASVTPADLTIQIGDASTVYGTKFDETKYGYNYVSGITNGDTEETLDAAFGGMNYTNDAALDGTDGKWTKEVGNYDLTGEGANSLMNYNVTYLKGTATVTPYTITKKDIVDGNPHFSTVYGTTTTPVEVAIKGVNGDATVENTATTSAYIYDDATGEVVKTKDVGDKTYDITSVLTNKNYRFEDGSDTKLFANTASVTPADLTIQIGDASTVYGTKFDETKYGYTYVSGITNGDTEETLDAAFGGMNYTNTAALDGTNGKWTKGVGDYALKGEGANGLKNYKVTYLDGTATVTPYTITEEEIVNPDGSPLYTTKYGQKDAFGKATFAGVNGDGMLLLDITDSSALTGAADGRITENVGDNIYDTTVSLEGLENKNYQFENGESSKTFENTASVTPAELTIETKDVETEYGTVKETTSEVKGLVNGDLPTGFLFDYGDYGGAYLDGNTKTNDVNTYHFGTELSGADFLNNYTITGGEADVKIDPKDVTFFVSGTGNTLADVTYTVDPDIDAQLAYSEHVDADYMPGNDLGSNQYGVVAHINGTPIVTGDVAGNYRYNYGGLITLSPTVPTKPDIDPHNPSNLDGSGSWTSNMGNHGVPGVERVAGLASAELPFFKVEAGQVSHYGTYDVAADPDRVRLEPTGKRLPEPNQPKTQYREYTKALTTTDGTGMFRMVYDGSVFRITPVDDAAFALVRTGDVKNNVELSAEALHAGFSEMGILLEDLDGVYVHFENLH